MSVISVIKSGFDIIGSAMAYITDRFRANNTPSMVSRKEAQEEVKKDDKDASNIKNKKSSDIINDMSE
jgi:hypothetical protein